ncbi:MAG TPA: substrate-binding domain-containing protein [Anaerolineales bacterium]|nr:substrate-binding domain-containing protein [Anaerolineales bacterium]
MFKSVSKNWMKTVVLLVGLALIATPLFTAGAVDSRPTGSAYVNTDGSTTLFPIFNMAAYQFTAFHPGEYIVNDSGNGTGSGHGRMSLLSQLPITSANGGGNVPIDIALASSACGGGDQYVPGSDATHPYTSFTENSMTATSTASSKSCSDLDDLTIAKDAITILVNNTKATCIMASTGPHYITKNMILAIWGGQAYNNEPVDTSTNIPADENLPSGTAGATQHTWNDFWPGCGSENIVPTARIVGSGTRQSFLDLTGVSAANEAAEVSQRYTANADVENAISNNAAYIGYTGMAFDNSKTYQLPVQSWSIVSSAVHVIPAATPSSANVISGAYPFNRFLHVYTLHGTTKQSVLDVLSWLKTSVAQGDIKRIGFIAANDANVPGFSAPAPDWDVNGDHNADVLDVTSIGAYFGACGPASPDPSDPACGSTTHAVRGWVRADINYSGGVDILDITTFGPHFGASW